MVAWPSLRLRRLSDKHEAGLVLVRARSFAGSGTQDATPPDADLGAGRARR